MEEEMMAAPVTVGIAGYAVGAIGFASDSDDATRGEEVFHVFEFAVSGSTTLDNGITVGVHGQLGSSGGDFDEQFVTMSGAFGSLRVGRTEAASWNATVAAPGAGLGGSFGVNNSWYNPASHAVNTFKGNGSFGDDDAAKVVYTSPNFNGLTIGLSYAPEDHPGSFTGRNTAGLGEHTAVGVSYSTAIMEGGSLNIGLAYEQASSGSSDDPSAMKVGAVVSVDQISFGGGMYDDNGVGMQFDVGASWTEGPTTLGIQYGHNESNAGGNETSMLALHLDYNLGPSVSVGAQLASSSADNLEDATQILLGTSIGF